MKVSRIGVFETNSSSVHSMTIVSAEDYHKWENGELFYDTWNERLVDKEYAKSQDKFFPYDNFQHDCWGDYITLDDGEQKYVEKQFITPEDFDELEYEFFEDTTPDGEWKIFGYYGSDR